MLVAPMRRSVMSRYLNKSNRIGIRTCCVSLSRCVIIGYFQNSYFYFANEKNIGGKVWVQYSSKVQLKQLIQKYPMMTQRRSQTHSKFICQYGFDLSRRRRMTQRRCGITIRLVLLAINFLPNDLICPDSDF